MQLYSHLFIEIGIMMTLGHSLPIFCIIVKWTTLGINFSEGMDREWSLYPVCPLYKFSINGQVYYLHNMLTRCIYLFSSYSESFTQAISEKIG